ncbi:hypothetical protein [Xenorhabdus szentirmaii]|uniref:hypothetical protein n=1 Tax=Xenorhabdus szentirmaii TaxID=290112 RepID=UPI000C041749|nr:hypothetical protein [Xenorhabdus szentirmaii]PHM43741.1 hypothetical protein Xszus_03545 [Xenorhabdus szentirmaii]
MVLDALNAFVLLERIELIAKIGGSDDFGDKDRQLALHWVEEMVLQVKSELVIEKPLNSGSKIELCGTGLQQI